MFDKNEKNKVHQKEFKTTVLRRELQTTCFKTWTANCFKMWTSFRDSRYVFIRIHLYIRKLLWCFQNIRSKHQMCFVLLLGYKHSAQTNICGPPKPLSHFEYMTQLNTWQSKISQSCSLAKSYRSSSNTWLIVYQCFRLTDVMHN